MDVIDALVSHPATLKQLYQQSETNPDVFDQFLRHLVVHHTMEEKFFSICWKASLRLAATRSKRSTSITSSS
jgi:hypothetical protein